jgi:regulation of enolase protein 1 (concanavalin A-like superfamily)
MPRLSAAVLLAALTALAAWGAPAPLPKRGDWCTGWDKPVDPLGGCRFRRRGGELTVTGAGKARLLAPRKGRLTAPRLLRAVEGDFVVQVRLAATFRRAGRPPQGATFQAGLLLTDGRAYVRWVRHEYLALVAGLLYGSDIRRRSEQTWCEADVPLARPFYLRLERRGDELRAAYSQDGRKWLQMGVAPGGVTLRRKAKAGVFVEATVPGAFKVTFDRFKLTPLRK